MRRPWEKGKTRQRGWYQELSPYVVIVLLVALPLLFRTETEYSEETVLRNERIRDAVDAAPWIINHRWFGRDFSIPYAALRILRPTAILCREYEVRDPFHDGERSMAEGAVVLVVVHCSNIRDMQGHYPPVCYPAQGWESAEGDAKVLDLACETIPDGRMTRYEYCMGGGLEERQMRSVLNLFLLPNGEVVPDMDSLRRLKAGRATSAQGIAQVQLVVDHRMGDATCVATIEELIDGMPELFGLLLGREEEPQDVTPRV